MVSSLITLFLFVSVWPPMWGGPVQDYWTIHGIWPEYTDGGWPEYCGKPSFDPSVLKPLETHLTKYWTPFSEGTPEELWKHEYLKHGSCVNNTFLTPELAFFAQGLTLREKYPVYKLLKKIGATPGMSINKQTLLSQYTKMHGHTPIPVCLKSNLLYVMICLDRSLGVCNCSYPVVTRNDNCPETIVYAT